MGVKSKRVWRMYDKKNCPRQLMSWKNKWQNKIYLVVSHHNSNKSIKIAKYGNAYIL